MAVAFGTSSTASHSSTYVSSLSINKPTSTVNGDLLILAVETSPTSQSGPTVTPPAGWTALSGSPYVGSTGSALWVWYKIAASEGSSYSLGFSPTIDDVTALIARYTGVDNTTPIANSSSTTASSVTSKAVAAPTGIASGGVSVMIGGARPDAGTASLTITMPGTSRVASFYASAGSSDFGAGMALSDSTATASGNMTVNHSSEVSEVTLVLAAASGGGSPVTGTCSCTLSHVSSSFAGSVGNTVSGSFSCILGAQCSGGGGGGDLLTDGRTLAFDGDFTSTLDTDKFAELSTSYPSPYHTNPGDHKLDYVTTGKCVVTGSSGSPELTITTAYDASHTVTPPGESTEHCWTTGLITTNSDTGGGGFTAQVGDLLLCRVQLPSWNGAWPGFWTWNTSGGTGHGEVDVFEYHPDNANLLELNNHVASTGDNYTDSDVIYHGAWVWIACEVGEDSCKWYVGSGDEPSDMTLMYDDETGVGSGWTAGIIINTSVTDGFYHDPPTGTGSYTSKFSHMQVWR